jgi:serine/threonine-protein kinase
MSDAPKLSASFPPSYRVERVLGKGAMGVVLAASQLRLGRRVAIKMMLAESFQDEGSRRRFVQEAQVLARLSHPNIVSVFDANLDGDCPFLVMEYVEGPNLEQLVRERERLPVSAALELSRQLLDGLGYRLCAQACVGRVDPMKAVPD